MLRHEVREAGKKPKHGQPWRLQSTMGSHSKDDVGGCVDNGIHTSGTGEKRLVRRLLWYYW